VVPASEIQVYDFKRPERVSKEQIVALETLHEIFARNLSASLSGYLRTVVEVRLISVEQFTYSEFTMSLPSPTSINLLSCTPLEGNMILEINPSIIFPVIDRLLGGGSMEAFLLDRPFTSIEQGLVNSILTRVLEQLTQTWENIRPLKFEIIETESNPFLMQIVAPNEPIVLHSFEVLMGDYSGMINLCIPFKVIEPIIPEFSTSNWFVSSGEHAPPGARDQILENISQASLEVSAILADLPLRLADLLTLKPGDIIDTQKPVDSELILAVEEERKFAGRPGTSHGKIAFRITRREEPSPAPETREI
jgi:flagellar motor switch protein FliM